jgi:hypothetical protein
MEALVFYCYAMTRLNIEREVVWQTLQSFFVELQVVKIDSFSSEHRKSKLFLSSFVSFVFFFLLSFLLSFLLV